MQMKPLDAWRREIETSYFSNPEYWIYKSFNNDLQNLTEKSANLLRWNSAATHVENIWPEIAIFPHFQVYRDITQAKRILNFSLLSDIPMKSKTKTNYWFGHSLWSVNQLLAQEVKPVLNYITKKKKKKNDTKEIVWLLID